MISARDFEALTGRRPVGDDLDRVNCVWAGTFGHRQCGWCDHCEHPKFDCHCPLHSPTDYARKHQCLDCTHVFIELVRMGVSPNLSGELSTWCKACGSKNVVSYPAFLVQALSI